MKAISTLSILLVVATLAFAPPSLAEDTPDDKIKKALTRKVTFEFQDTPLSDALDFIRHLSNVPIIVDPKVLADVEKSKINLRVADMDLDKALQWILKLGELEYKIQDQAIFIFGAGMENAGDAAQKKQTGGNDAGVLRIKFASGDSLEADGIMLKQFPYLEQEIRSLSSDPAKDEILVLADGDIPSSVPVATFIETAKRIAPGAKFELDEKLKLLYVRSTDASDLRSVNAIARALRRSASKAIAQEMKIPPVAVKPAPATVKPPRPPDEPKQAKPKLTPDAEPQF